MSLHFHSPPCHWHCPGSDFSTLSLNSLSDRGGKSHHLAPKIVKRMRLDTAKKDALGKPQGTGGLRHHLEQWCHCEVLYLRHRQADSPNLSSLLALPQICCVPGQVAWPLWTSIE